MLKAYRALRYHKCSRCKRVWEHQCMMVDRPVDKITPMDCPICDEYGSGETMWSYTDDLLAFVLETRASQP